MKKPLSKFKCIYIETNLDSSRLQVLYTDGITITEHVSHSLIKHWHEEIERVVHSMTKYSGERHTPFHRALIFILTQAQFIQSDCWNDQWELSNLQRSQPHHSHLQSRLHTNCDVCFPHALDTAVGMHRNTFLSATLLESISVEKRNKALYLPRRLRHFNTLVTQREEKKEPSQISIFQEQT